MPLWTNLLVIFDAHISIIAETIGCGLTTNSRQQLADHRVVNAHNRTTIKRQVMQEINKRLLQIFEVAMVGIHMIGFDIGNNRHHRLQMQE